MNIVMLSVYWHLHIMGGMQGLFVDMSLHCMSWSVTVLSILWDSVYNNTRENTPKWVAGFVHRLRHT